MDPATFTTANRCEKECQSPPSGERLAQANLQPLHPQEETQLDIIREVGRMAQQIAMLALETQKEDRRLEEAKKRQQELSTMIIATRVCRRSVAKEFQKLHGDRTAIFDISEEEKVVCKEELQRVRKEKEKIMAEVKDLDFNIEMLEECLKAPLVEAAQVEEEMCVEANK